MEQLLAEVVEQAQNGNECDVVKVVEHCTENEIFEAMLKKWERAFILDEADDLRSEAKLKLLSWLGDFDSERGVPFERYFMIGFKRALIDKVRHDNRERKLFGGSVEFSFKQLDDGGRLDPDDCADIRRLVSGMGGRMRVVADLVMLGFQKKEIAEMVDVTLGVVRCDLDKIGDRIVFRGIAASFLRRK